MSAAFAADMVFLYFYLMLNASFAISKNSQFCQNIIERKYGFELTNQQPGVFLIRVLRADQHGVEEIIRQLNFEI
jgi:hypothetical protein